MQVLSQLPGGNREMRALAGPVDDVRSVGTTLFTSYTLPFQIVAVLVLVATVGVVVLSKRELE